MYHCFWPCFCFWSFCCFLIHIILVFGAVWRLRRLRVLNASTNVDLFLIPGGWGNFPEGNIKTAMLLDTKWYRKFISCPDVIQIANFLEDVSRWGPILQNKLWRNKPSENPRIPGLCGAKRWMTFRFAQNFKTFPQFPTGPTWKTCGPRLGLLRWWSMILLMVQRSQGQPTGLGCLWSPGKIMGFQVPTGPTGEPDFWTINSIFGMFPG